MSHGATPEEALHNLAEVTEVYISASLEKGLEVPPPKSIEISWDVFPGPTACEADVDTYVSPSITPPIFAPVT